MLTEFKLINENIGDIESLVINTNAARVTLRCVNHRSVCFFEKQNGGGVEGAFIIDTIRF